MPGDSPAQAPGRIGERFFGRRARLAEVVDAVIALAGATGTELGADDAALATRLRAPFRVLALGEVNAGKSTLLNALFDTSLCQAGCLPHPTRIAHFRHASHAAAPPLHTELDLRLRADPLLERFELLESPGAQSGSHGHERVLEGLFEWMDVILVVFPVGNPWAAASWELLGRVPAEKLARVVLVLQQCDQRESGELPVICAHVRDLAGKRLGMVPPVVAVAAQASRAGGLGAWQRSGMAELQAQVEALVCESAEAHGGLREARRLAAAMLRRIEDRMDDQVRQAEDHAAFLRQLEAEVDHEREKHIRKLARQGDGLGEVLAASGAATAEFLRGRLGLLRSMVNLILPDNTATQAEAFLVEQLKHGMQARAAAEAAGLLDACRAHWQALGPRVRARMGIDIPPFDGCEQGLAVVRAEFIERLGLASRQPVANLKLRASLNGLVQRRRRGLARLMAAALGTQTLAGTAGFLGWTWIAWPALAATAVLACSMVWGAWRSRRQLLGEFADDLLSARARFAEMLASEYQTGIRGFFLEYATMFQAVRRRIAEGREQLRPRMERWNELFLALKALEQEL